MREVEEFYETYYEAHSVEPQNQQRVVYTATDEPAVLGELVQK